MTEYTVTKVTWDSVQPLVRQALLYDLQNAETKEMARALRKVLKYYSSPAEWKEYKETYE
jgi:hypothetical protein